MSQIPEKVNQIPGFAILFKDANHIDVKTVEGDVTLREFIAGFINYLPTWIKFLYGVRKVFVRLLGMHQEGVPHTPNLKPETIPFNTGEKLTFFTVEAAQEEQFFVASAIESHLAAYLGIVVEPVSETRNRFYVVTIVHYHKWTGPVYFNVIRPFHHLVVGKMAQAGIAGL